MSRSDNVGVHPINDLLRRKASEVANTRNFKNDDAVVVVDRPGAQEFLNYLAGQKLASDNPE
ncbi:MAG: hypothetical protein IPG56_01930 [Caulobacteraceae bacterium]|nr:hypothetical protein [Caulobacteraceae bacterium]